MPNVTWNATSGNWFVNANWDEPNPNAPPPLLHIVPGADDNVSVPDNSGTNSPFTVTYNGTSSIRTLNGSLLGTLDITGGSLTVLESSPFNSMAINVANGATLGIASGTLNITSGNYAGNLAGAGTLQFLYGTFNLNAGISVTVDNWTLGVTSNGTFSKTNLNVDLTYAKNFLLADYSGNHAVLNLLGHTLTLTGDSTFDGTVVGPGKVLITGDAVNGSGAYGTPVFMGGATVQYAGGSTAVQHLLTRLGDAATKTNGTMQIDAGAVYTIDTTTTLGNTASDFAFINNAGTLKITGASTKADLAAQFANTGTVTVDGGTSLQMGSGGTYTLGGSIGGAGSLILGHGDTFINTKNVTVGAMTINGGNLGSLVTLGTDLTYGGKFSFGFIFDTLDLNGHTLSLSGNANTLIGNIVDGPGTIKVAGASTIGGNISLGGLNGTGTAVTLQNSGAISQIGGVGLNGTLINDLGKTYTITKASDIFRIGNGTSTIIVNNGTLADNAAGLSRISGDLSHNGTLAIASGATLALERGTDTLGGTISGLGTLVIGGGADATLNTTSLSVSALTLSGGNTGAALSLGKSIGYGGAFSFANQFDTLDLNGFTFTLAGTKNSLLNNVIDGGGTLRITGAATIGGNVDIGGLNGNGTALTLLNTGAVTQVSGVGLHGTILNDVGKTYTISVASDIYRMGNGPAIFTNNGTLLDNAVGTSRIGGDFTNNAHVTIVSGATLVLERGTNKLGGTISGDGTLMIGGGTTTLLNTANVTVDAIVLAGGNLGTTLKLGTNVNYAGTLTFAQQFDTVDLNAKTLTLSGTGNSLLNNDIVGGGTMIVTGSATVGGGIVVGDPSPGAPGTTLRNSGALTQDGFVFLHGSLINDAGKTFAVKGGSHLIGYGDGGSATNNGLWHYTNAGTSEINLTFTNNGMLAISVGAVLEMRGTSVLHNSVIGAAGTLSLLSGKHTIDATTLTVGTINLGGGLVSLGGDVNYGGKFQFTNGFSVLDLNGHTLSLTGTVSFPGGTIDGLANAVDTLKFTGKAIDLSAMSFTNWTDGVDLIILNGGAGSDTLTGSSRADLIDGGAGAANTLRGLGGNDTYRVFNGSDVIVEGAAEGTADRVRAGVDFKLASSAYVEFIETVDAAATTPLALTGTARAQTITGNAGDNILHDGGTFQADALRGLGGNDTYRVYNTGDSIVETSTQGTADKVVAAVDYQLGANVYVEFMQTDNSTATTGIDLTGNDLSQRITGNAGANVLRGLGGTDFLFGMLGKDTLSGGTGKDYFVFNTAPSAANVDTVFDFNVADDTIMFDDVAFKALPTGTLATAAFRANTTGAAGDASDRIIYETDTGKLFYDADGLGGVAGVHFATLTGLPAVTNLDFVVV